MRREQEGPRQGGPGQSVPVNIQAQIATDGDFQIRNLHAFAFYGGGEVTEVPPGASWEIHATYEIRNLAAGVTFWSTCLTVYNETEHRIENADEFGNHLGSGWKNAIDAVNMTTIEVPTDYRVKVFANQRAFAGQPDPDQW